MSPPPRKSSWKDAAGGGTPSGGGGRGRFGWQEPQDNGRSPALPWWKKRSTLIGVVSFLLLAVVVTIVWVALWPKRVPPLRLVLIGAGYETNLAVPHNISGMRGLEALKAWAEDHNGQPGSDQIDVVPVKLGKASETDEKVVAALQDSGGKGLNTVVVFVAAHGTAVREGTELVPCLVRDEADLHNEESLYKLDLLVEELRKLPDTTRKIVLLDVTASPVSLPLGQLHNDFVGALEGRGEALRAIPNLVVITSSGRNQRSWVASEQGLTIFAHSLLQELKDRQARRVNVQDLYGAVRDRVEHWTWHNRARRQRPVQIAAEGVAERTELLPFGGYQPPETSSLAEARQKGLRAAWTKRGELQQAATHPAAYSPHLWRRYLDTLIRYEELVRAGDREEQAADLRGDLDELDRQITAARPMRLQSLPLTLTMPDALGMGLNPAETDGMKRFEQLWQEQKPPDEYQKALVDLERTTPDPLRRNLLRVKATGLVVRRALADLEGRWKYGRQVLAALDDPLEPWRPAEAHYLVMLRPDQDPAQDQLSPVTPLLAARQWPLLGKSLDVRLRAEEAALGLGKEAAGESLPAYSERILPWIQAAVEEADDKRRLGQDLLFTSDPERWREAEKLLGDADTLYGQAQEVAVKVRRAYQERDRVLAALPYYTRWLGEQPPGEPEEELLILWARTHALSRLLEQPPSGAENTKRSDQLTKVVTLTGEVAAGFGKVEKLLDRITQKDYSTAKTQASWHEIDNALSVPFLDPVVRVNLLRTVRDIATELDRATEKGSDPPADEPEKTQDGVRQAAQRRGRLALGMLGETWPDYDDVAAEIRRAELDNWSIALVHSGERLARALNRMPEDAQGLAGKASAEDLDKAAADLRLAVRLARQVPGYGVGASRLKADPVGDQRRLQLHDLLCWQAHRSFLNFWAAEPAKPVEKPYFRVAGRVFLNDAQGLVAARSGKPSAQRLVKVEAERNLLEYPWQMETEWSPDNNPDHFLRAGGKEFLTDERSLRHFYRLAIPAEVRDWVVSRDGPRGYPVRWVEPDKGLRLGSPEEGQRKTVDFGTVFTSQLMTDATNRIQPGSTRNHRVIGYFRGQRSVVQTSVGLEPEATTVLSFVPRGERVGHIGVQTTRRLYDRYGASNTALVLVLDCSKSMIDNKGEDGRTRFANALTGLRNVLESLPTGITVSLWAFGAREFKETDPVYGIKRVWEPQKWNPDRDAIAERMRKVERLNPEYGTPLVRTIWKARGDLPPPDFKGNRIIVALTDGVDESFDSDTDLKNLIRGRDKSVSAFLRQVFKDSGIRLDVIGFQVSSAEARAKSYQDFQKVIAELGGTYTDAQNTDRLAVALRQSLLQMYFWVDPDVGGDPRDVLDEGKDISRSDQRQNPRWVRVNAGRYDVRVPSVRNLHQRVGIDSGDSLLVDIVEGPGGRLAFRRSLYADSDLVRGFVRKAPMQEGWQLAVLQNRQLRGGDEPLHLMVTLDKELEVARPTDLLQVIRPDWVWFEVPRPDGKGDRAPRLRVTGLAGYPAPAWSLDLPRWPAGAPSALQAWWVPQKILPVTGRLIKPMFRSPLDLKRQPWPTARAMGQVILEGVTIEQIPVRYDPDDPRKEFEVEALVVRLSYPIGGEPFFVQLPNWDRGQEHRFYNEAGKYTGIFWNMTRADADKLTELQLISVTDVKERGLGIKRLELGPPDERKGPNPLTSQRP